MASDFIPNLGSQIDRALRALFLADGAVTAEQVFVVTDFRTRPAPPLLDIKTTSCTPVVPFTGNYSCQVDLFFKFSAVTDTELDRVAMDQFVGGVGYSLFRGDYNDGMPTVCAAINAAARALAVSDPANNADMAGFTVSRITPGTERRGFPIGAEGGVDGSYWVEQRSLEIMACSETIN
jgi:hypothetical protein